jgi:nucleoside-diphosphate-sugar epimerase
VRILVTGASGFVGRAAVFALAGRDVDVHAMSRRPSHVPHHGSWHKVDLLDRRAVESAVSKIRPDAVLHLAWYAEHGAFWNAPENLDWVGASLALARASADAGAQRFVGTGTCFEYGDTDGAPCSEADTPVCPADLYSVAKDACRRVIAAFAADSGFSFAWARLFYLYGPGEDERRLVPSLARSLAAGESADCSSGLVERDFMDVRDAGEALAAIALSDVAGPINIATGEATSVATVAETLGALCDRPDLVRIGALPDRPNEPSRVVADVKRLRAEVNFRPDRSLEEGLRDALDYWIGRNSRAAG